MRTLWRYDHPTGTNPFWFFVYASTPHWRAVVVALGAVVVASVLYTVIAYVFKLIVDAATAFSAGGSYLPLLWAAGGYIAVSFSAELLWRLSGYMGSFWSTGARATARHSLTSYITLHGRDYFSDRFAGSLASKIRDAANGCSELVESFLWQFTSLAVSIIASFVLAFTTSSLIAWIFLVWVAVVIPLNYYFARRRVPYSIAAHAAESNLTGATVDLLGNISAMQDYARRDMEMGRLRESILHRRTLGLRNWHFGELILTVNGFIQTAFAALIVFVAVYLARQGAVSPGDIVLILTMIFRLEEQFLFVGSNINNFAERWGEIRESLEEVLLPHDIPDHPEAKELKVDGGVIETRNVTFGYGTDAVFEHLSLTIPGGQRVGLVGKSGSGKSTFMRLLLHHHDVWEGAIMIDRQDIAQVTQESLRRNIGVVPQEPLLFHRTIAENIAYGRPEATEDEIIHAAQLANAHEFIARLPEGYQSLVGERGIKLSGGERQRVAIARAILKNAPVLLLDEATSALDSQSEVAIQAALRELMVGKTVIAIAHRLSTLREMDRLIVMEQGRIVEDGSHDELLKKGGLYATLWSHQAGGFLPDDDA